MWTRTVHSLWEVIERKIRGIWHGGLKVPGFVRQCSRTRTCIYDCLLRVPVSVKAHVQSRIEVLQPGETKPGVGGSYLGLDELSCYVRD